MYTKKELDDLTTSTVAYYRELLSKGITHEEMVLTINGEEVKLKIDCAAYIASVEFHKIGGFL